MLKFFSKKYFGINVVGLHRKEIDKIIQAFTFVKTKEEKIFKTLRFLKAILVFPGKNYDNVFIPEKKIYVCQPKTILESGAAYLASLFVHEARHISQYKQGKKYGGTAEIDAYKFQRKFLVRYGNAREVQWLDKQFRKKWWVPKKREKVAASRQDNAFRKFADLYISGKLNSVMAHDNVSIGSLGRNENKFPPRPRCQL